MKSVKEQTKTALWIGALLLFAALLLLISNSSWHFWNSWTLSSLDKMAYANELYFDSRMIIEGERITAEDAMPRSVTGEAQNRMFFFDDPRSIEVVFVYTEKEALNFPDDVVVTWPSTRTLQWINAFNWVIYHHDSKGLRDEFPITLTNVVYDWKRVYRLLDFEVLSLTQRALRTGEGNDSEFLAKLEDAIRKSFSEDIPQSIISLQTIYYADELDFNFRMVAGDEIITEAVAIAMHTQALYPEFLDPFYTDFVFVETEEKALTFPDNVITAWPSEDTSEVLNAINWIILGGTHDSSFIEGDTLRRINLLELSLEVPVDVFEDWEEIGRLVNYLDDCVRVHAQVSTGTIRREANSPEFLAELESLKEQRNTEVSE